MPTLEAWRPRDRPRGRSWYKIGCLQGNNQYPPRPPYRLPSSHFRAKPQEVQARAEANWAASKWPVFARCTVRPVTARAGTPRPRWSMARRRRRPPGDVCPAAGQADRIACRLGRTPPGPGSFASGTQDARLSQRKPQPRRHPRLYPLRFARGASARARSPSGRSSTTPGCNGCAKSINCKPPGGCFRPPSIRAFNTSSASCTWAAAP